MTFGFFNKIADFKIHIIFKYRENKNKIENMLNIIWGSVGETH